MAVMIRGMEMPKDCNKCPMTVDGYCRIIGYPNGDAINKRYKPLWCPLVEVPKHGRLIDADALMDGWMHLRDAIKYGNKNAEQQRHSYSRMMMYEIADEIDDAPTIIEAEE